MAKPKIFIVLFTNENIRDTVWEDVSRLYFKRYYEEDENKEIRKIWSFIDPKKAINVITINESSFERVKYSSIPPVIFTTHKDYYTDALYNSCEVVKVIVYDIFSDSPEKLMEEISKLEDKK